jgi:tetratricopeptide (TPR) repeat protein
VSPSPDSPKVDLLDLPLSDLRRRLQDGATDPPARIAESLRAEASRFYQTDAVKARRIAHRAAEVGELSGDAVAIGWGERAMAEALLFSGRPADAEGHYERAAAAWRASRQDRLLGQLQVGRMAVLTLLGRHDSVEQAAVEARRLLTAAGDKVYLAKLAMNLGGLRFEREQYAPALEEYDSAAELFRELGIRDESVIGLEFSRGLILNELNRDDEAIALLSSLEEECEKSGYELYLAQVRMNAGYVHSQRADYDLALRALGSATEYFRRVEHPALLGSCYLNRAEIYHHLNLHREALELTEQAEPLFAQIGLRYDQGLSKAQSALSHLGLGEFGAAVRQIRAARRLFQRERNASRVALMELLWAEALSTRRARRQEAEARARQAAATFQTLGLLRWEAAAAVLLSELEGERAAPEGQIAQLTGLLERVSPRIYPIPAYRLLEALGGAQERGGMAKAAEATYRRALTHLEDLRVRIPTEDSKIAFLRDKTHLYDRMLSLELARPRPSIDRIFEWMERSRAQSLWDRVRSPQTFEPAEGDDPAGRQLVAQRRRLSWMHARLSRLELGSAGEQAQAAAMRRSVAEAEKEWSRALREAGESASRSGPASRDASSAGPDALSSTGLLDVGSIERRLPTGWGLASYHIGPDFGIVVVITEEGSAWRALRPDLLRRLARLGEQLDFQWGSIAMSAVRRSRVLREASAVSAAHAASERALRDAADEILKEAHRLLWKPVQELAVDRALCSIDRAT